MSEQETGAAGGGVRISRRTGKPVRKRQRWTAARQEMFLEHLARTCNVSFALQAVGMSASGLHGLRQRDAGFADQFDGALQSGYQCVEAELLAHVLGFGGAVEQGESGPVAVPAFNPELALKVLQQRGGSVRVRRDNGGAPVKRATEREIEDVLVSKLKGLAKRLALVP